MRAILAPIPHPANLFAGSSSGRPGQATWSVLLVSPLVGRATRTACSRANPPAALKQCSRRERWGRRRRGSRTPESGGSSSDQSPQPDSWRKKRRNESRRWHTPRRPQRGASGLPLLDSRNRLGFGSVILHRDDALVPEVHDGRGLRRPLGATDLARVRDDDHGLFSAVAEL
jgi:hypothetical protein